VSTVVLDDHLLRDLLTNRIGDELARLLSDHDPATTNLYHFRLCRSVVSARGGSLTGGWSIEQRAALNRPSIDLPAAITVVPMSSVAFRMAEIADAHRVSTLGAEVVAAAEQLNASIAVWRGDDGPGLRAAAEAAGLLYLTLAQ
jgi:hypothetical protein